jgi:NADH-ubiquinone oxidoreductase chain 3
MSSMTFFFLFVSILALVFLIVNFIFAPHNPYKEKTSIFECGFDSFSDQNRMPFGIKFGTFGILFLLFDLEITLLFPYGLSEGSNGLYGLLVVVAFGVFITLGFIFEIGKGALTIDSRQNIQLNTKPSNITELIGKSKL